MAPATPRLSHSAARRRPWARARHAACTAWTFACIATIVGAVIIAAGTRWHGLTPLAVKSGSMEPTLPVHSLILVHAVRPKDVRVGDIITFDPPGPTPRVTHRVVERERVGGSQWYFRTKGDANPTPDDWRRGMDHPERYHPGVTYGDRPAVRHVVTIPYGGSITTLLPARLRLALLLLPLAWVGVGLLVAIWRPGRAERSGRRATHGAHGYEPPPRLARG
jgi:signal peptidase